MLSSKSHNIPMRHRHTHSITSQPTRIPAGARIAPILLMTALFGPYLATIGFRADHLIVYGPLLLFLPFGVARLPLFGPHHHRLILLWSLLTLWILLVSALLPRSPQAPSIWDTLAALDNLLFPLALTLFLAILLPAGSHTARRTFYNFLHISVLAFAIHSIAVLASLFIDLTDFWALFWNPEANITGISVGHRSAEAGRHTGVFNQPFESGVAYSASLLSWVVLRSAPNTDRLSHTSNLPILTILLLGGLLSASKVFLLVGIPLAVLLALVLLKGLGHARHLALPVAIAGAGAAATWIPWTGLARIQATLDIFLGRADDPIRQATAGRFAAETTPLMRAFEHVWEQSPISGLGLVPQVGALDNAFFAFFAMGGTIAVLLYSLFLLALFYNARHLRRQDRTASLFLLSLGALIFLSGGGAPPLTVNRASTYLWALLTLTLWLAHQAPRSSPPNSNSSIQQRC